MPGQDPRHQPNAAHLVEFMNEFFLGAVYAGSGKTARD
jgi:hypothetical protein